MDIASPAMPKIKFVLPRLQRHRAIGPGRNYHAARVKRSDIRPMGDADECRFGKVFIEQTKHFLLRRFVQRRCSLIHEQPIGFMQQSAGKG